MKKAVIIVSSLVFICLLAFAVIKTFFMSVPVFAPAFLPTKENIRADFATPLTFPLTIPNGYEMKIYADLNGDLPRVLTFDPMGVLVASVPGRGKVVALPDGKEKIIVNGLKQPHGIVFTGSKLYVAETNKVSRYDYDPVEMRASNREELYSLPSGAGHSTRTIKVFDSKLFVSTGSSCNVCIEKDAMRSAIWVSDLDGKNLREFAKGLRNTVFFTFDRKGQMWGNDMGRDLLGDNLPPDELNIIKEGGDYGWPYCYGEKVRDQKFMPEKNVNCEQTIAPEFGYPAHVAPLGIAFDPEQNLLASLHGSWNSSVPVGYKVVKLTVKNGQVTGMSDFISGWSKDGKVSGRPVDLIFDNEGRLFISDDKAGLIYIVTRK